MGAPASPGRAVPSPAAPEASPARWWLHVAFLCKCMVPPSNAMWSGCTHVQARGLTGRILKPPNGSVGCTHAPGIRRASAQRSARTETKTDSSAPFRAELGWSPCASRSTSARPRTGVSHPVAYPHQTPSFSPGLTVGLRVQVQILRFFGASLWRGHLPGVATCISRRPQAPLVVQWTPGVGGRTPWRAGGMQSPLWWLRAVRILLALLGFNDAAAPTGTPPPTRCWWPRRPRAGHAGSKSTPPPSQITHFTLPIPLTLSHPPPPTTTRAPAAHDRKNGCVRLFWSRCVCACGFLSFINMYCVIFSQFVGSRARARKKRLGHWGAEVSCVCAAH